MVKPTDIREEEKFLMAAAYESTDLLKPETRRTGWIPVRYTFAILASFGIMNVYAMRVNLSVALVAMVNRTAIKIGQKEIVGDCYENATDSTAQDGEFVWSELTQSLILGSFFLGYIITQLPGGRMAELYSAKWIFGIGILCTAIFTLLTPVAANAGPWYLGVVRVFEGLGEGVTFPTMHAMIARWSPPLERSRIVTIIFSGSLLGTVIGLPVSGILTEHGFAGGWPSVFYVFGACGIFWFILWTAFAHDSPDQHPFISQEEKDYIKQSIGCKKYSTSPPVPWKTVFKSLPVWAIVVSHFSFNWGFYTLLTELPTYLKTILHYNMQKNAFMSALPYFTSWIFGLSCSALCDKIIEMKIMTTTGARKAFQTFGHVCPALCMLGVTFTGCNKEWPFVLLVLAVTTGAATYGGFQGNHIDIAPNYAGTLLGITNTFATIPGSLGPYTVGALTDGRPYRSQWSIVFYIASAIYLFSAVFYVIFGRGDEQPWNRFAEEKKIIHDESEDEVEVYSVKHRSTIKNSD